jgi:hypothetical protein
MIDAHNLSRGVVDGGRARVIATTGRERMPALPQTDIGQGSSPHFADSAAFRRLIEEERVLWSRVVRDGNLQPE